MIFELSRIKVWSGIRVQNGELSEKPVRWKPFLFKRVTIEIEEWRHNTILSSHVFCIYSDLGWKYRKITTVTWSLNKRSRWSFAEQALSFLSENFKSSTSQSTCMMHQPYAVWRILILLTLCEIVRFGPLILFA